MLSQRGVASKFPSRKRKFGTTDGVLRRLRPANRCEEEKSGSSSDAWNHASKQPCTHAIPLVWSLISQHVASSWAQSVVSLASFDEGGSMHPGIVFDHTKPRAYLLTTLTLFRSTDHDSVVSYNIKAKVCLPNYQVVEGVLVFHDLKHNLAVVSVLPEPGCVRAACLDHQHQQLESPSQVVGVRRCFNSGQLITTTGMFAGDLMGAYRQEAADGVILIDFLGDVVGLNCYGKEGTTFIPRSTILEFLAVFQKACVDRKARSADFKRRYALSWKLSRIKVFDEVKLKPWPPSDMSCLEGSSRMEKKQSACHCCDPEGQSAPGDCFKRLLRGRSWPARGDSEYKEAARNRLRSRGYPCPVSSDCGMRLLCNFEEEFDEDIWSKLTERVAFDMSQSVVALASFSGDKRFFACTGIVIGCNELTTRVLTSASLVRNTDDEAKVADNLKIEVCLPDNEHATGTLENYSLRYNIAIITIIGSRNTRTVQICDELLSEPCGEVAAVGRVYESGKLMATGGTLIDKPSELDCKELKLSTCKITKAGIGGPLIDYAGNFMGMDFYGLEETPYLPRNVVLEVLRSLDTKPDATDMINDQNPNRWPVPKPCWCYPTWHDYMGEGVILDHRPQPM